MQLQAAVNKAFQLHKAITKELVSNQFLDKEK
jgi:hypothetical protein